MKKLLMSLSFAAMIFSASAQAQLFTNSFSGSFTNTFGTNLPPNPYPYNGLPIDDVTVSDLNKVGITNQSSTGNFRGSSWALDPSVTNRTGSIDLGKYMEFGLTADVGTTLNMSNITFGIGRSATGPRDWEWRSSLDNFASALTNYSSLNAGLSEALGVLTVPDANSSWTGNVLDLSGGSFDNLSSITFRFYGYNAESAAGTGGLQGTLSFTGASVVPEPSTYALLALSGLALAGYAARRRQRQK